MAIFGPDQHPEKIIETDKKVIISGAEKRIDSISASGKAANPIKWVV